MDEKIEKKKWPLTRILLYVVIAGAFVFLMTSIYRTAGTSRLNVEGERILTDTIIRVYLKNTSTYLVQ